jgi:PKD repeat protein
MIRSLRVALLLLPAAVSFADIHYVWRDNPNTPVPPYSSWASAATNIQDAVDSATSGDTVLVTNGTYNIGGRVAPGDTTLNTRLVIGSGITVQSVNGPESTFIVGKPGAGANGLGDAAYRCVYLTNAVLSGFTVTNGFTRGPSTLTTVSYWGGGIRADGPSGIVTNCVIVACNANTRGGGVYSGTLFDCVVVSNAVVGTATAAAGGGGTYNTVAWRTRIARNRTQGSSQEGGGAYGGVLYDCSVVSNSAGRYGGGVYVAGITNCTIEANSAATSGGGAYQPGAVTNCVFRGNTAVTAGGGLYQATLVMASQIVSNRVTSSAGDGGGFYGAAGNRLVGCSVVGNEAPDQGGGVYNAVLSNCVVQANRALGTSATTGLGGGFYASAATYFADRCYFIDNRANYQGGGAYQGKFFSCVFSGNYAQQAGGFYGSPSYGLYSCTVMGNSASNSSGGTYSGVISNSIVYANTALSGPNYTSSAFSYSCAAPLPAGTGNVNVEPLVSGYRDPHLLPGSPLIGAGAYSAWMTAAKDIDGEARSAGGLTDIGADQFDAANLNGPLEVEIVASTNVCTVGDTQTFRAEAEGRVKSLTWTFGDGAAASGLNPASHTFSSPGVYTVRVAVSNDTTAATATVQIQVIEYTLYVSPSGSHTAPFDTWATAATNIQAAVDAVAIAGGRVLVTNGVYATGSRVAGGQSVTNRLALDKAVRVESVNGPTATAIVGRWHSEASPLGGGALRCVYVADGAVLSGFTLSNGATFAAANVSNGRGGGLFLAQGGLATNCVITACRAWSGGGAASDPSLAGELRGCTLITNVALAAGSSPLGGGAANVTLTDCSAISNACAGSGGGAYQCTVSGGTFAGNAATQGGGAYNSVVDNCELRGNVATSSGAGVYQGTLRGCRLYDNVASGTSYGGGAYDATLYSCVLSGNRAYQGGGAYGSSASKGLFSCTVVGNAATVVSPNPGGGGFFGGSGTNYTVRNCIVYYNESAVSNNLYRGTVQYTCAEPLQAGAGNFEAAPLVASFERPVLLPGSPCEGQGLVEGWMAGTLDFEGEPRTDGATVDIGADESGAEAYGDPLTAAIDGAEWPYFPGTNYAFTAVVGGHPSFVGWEFGDGAAATNLAQVAHAWPEGLYTLRLTVSNAAHSAVAELAVSVEPDTRYVSPGGSHTPPFRTWATAATNLQDAADALGANGRIKVAAGVYDRGGRPVGGQSLSNRLCVGSNVAVIGVDGREATIIVGAASAAAVTNGLGAGAVRGVYLGAGASLQGFTVTNGYTFWSATATAIDFDGGGVACYDDSCVVRDCVVAGCAAAGYGGGIYFGRVYDTAIERNAVCGTGSGSGRGGGASYTELLSNCMVRANASTSLGGGAYLYGGEAVDCLVDGNAAASGGGGVYGASYPSDALNGCTIANNSTAGSGGGVYGAVLTDCLLTNNAAGQSGGGYANNADATHRRCRFLGNRAGQNGGGTYNGILHRCRLVGNEAAGFGGGAYSATLYNSALAANRAGNNGGGAYDCSLEACSVLGNSALSGGGTSASTAYSSIVYYNDASDGGANAQSSSLWGCCTTPADSYSLSAPPLISGFSDPHLLPGSPCLDAGLARGWMSGADSLDLDEEARVAGAGPDIGSDERDEAALAGPLAVSVLVDHDSFGVMYAPEFRAEVAGRVGDLIWDFGDGTSATNLNPVRHDFPALGVYTVRATATNLSGGASGEVSVSVTVGNTYVSRTGGHVPPFSSWATAATNVQDAVDAAIWGGTVWVTNGVYALGGRPAVGCALTNRVCVEKPLVLRGVGDPSRNVIAGRLNAGTMDPTGPAAVRGVWLCSRAVMSGLTVTNGATLDSEPPYATDHSGGGVYSASDASVSNCWITGCFASAYGGGGCNGAWIDCAVTECQGELGGGLALADVTRGALRRNVAVSSGGGIYEGSLTRCAVTGNTAGDDGGGASGITTMQQCGFTNNVAGGYGGAAYLCSGSACVFIGNSSLLNGGGAYQGVYEDSLFDGNESVLGDGGAFSGMAGGDGLQRCTLINNTAARYGGGSYDGDLADCLLTNNAAESGGGYYVPLVDASGTLLRCKLLQNRALIDGGGSHGATLYSCVVAENEAGQKAGGSYSPVLESCSVQGNSAGMAGGGCYGGEAFNSIIYHNAAPQASDVRGTVCTRCCTPGGAVGEAPQTTGYREPRLLPASPCLAAGFNREWMSGSDGLDMDSELRIIGAKTEIGADEASDGAASGPLSIRVRAESTSLASGYSMELHAEIGGVPAALFWNFGDGNAATNKNPVEHAFSSTGSFTVRATVTNASGSAYHEVAVSVVAGDVYVAPSGSHTPPFASWTTASTNIQSAVDATPWGGVVHIGDGVYRAGGRPAAGLTLTNRVCVERAMTLRSQNGPLGVTIKGAWHSPSEFCGPGAVRGVYLGHVAARLEGVSIEDGATALVSDEKVDQNGGGVFSLHSASVVSNCFLTGCTAASDGGGLWGGTVIDCSLVGNTADAGGGSSEAALIRCALSSNYAGWSGGGAYLGSAVDSSFEDNLVFYNDGDGGGGIALCDAQRCKISSNVSSGRAGGASGGVLVNCLLSGNSAESGGGACDSELYNCTVANNEGTVNIGGLDACSAVNSVVWGNVSPAVSNHSASAFCCSLTAPAPSGGYDLGGNVIADPQFVNSAAGSFRLRVTSPCVDAGTNISSIVGETDLDGRARMPDGQLDMGAYEYYSNEGYAALGTPIAWLEDYYAGPDWDAAELDDSDGDGFPAWQEYIALTSPTDGTSYFAVKDIAFGAAGAEVSFDTALGRVYTVQHSAGLSPLSWSNAASPVTGTGSRLTVAVPDASAAYYYRVQVSLP